MTHHLAQFNVARSRYALDAIELGDFMDVLDPVNAAADEAPGFVWRLQDDAGDATSIRLGGDPHVIINLSVWTDLASLRAYVLGSDHRAVLRRRREWFAPMDEAHLVLWWVSHGHNPDVDEASARSATLRSRGPSREAFTMARSFPAP